MPVPRRHPGRRDAKRKQAVTADDPRRRAASAYVPPGPRRGAMTGGARAQQPVFRSHAEESREPEGPRLRSEPVNLSLPARGEANGSAAGAFRPGNGRVGAAGHSRGPLRRSFARPATFAPGRGAQLCIRGSGSPRPMIAASASASSRSRSRTADSGAKSAASRT